MKELSSIGLLVLIISATLLIGPSSATNTKITEPTMGKEYSIYNQTSATWTDVFVYVNVGDNVSVKLDWVNGTSAPTVWIRPDGNCNGFYTSSSNDTVTNSCKLVMTVNTTYWIITAKESALDFSFDVPMGTTLNYTFSRINATIPGHTHPEFDTMSSFASNMTNLTNSLTSTVSEMNDTLNTLKATLTALKGNVTESEAQIADLREKYEDLLKNITELQSRIDALNIPKAANLTEVYNNLSFLSDNYTYLLENVSSIGELENVTNNITNNLTMVVYNNESTVEVIIGIDSNVSDSLNDTASDVQNLTAGYNATLASISGLDDKIGSVENKSATKSSLKKAVADKAPIILIGILFIVIAFSVSLIWSAMMKQHNQIVELYSMIENKDDDIPEAKARIVEEDYD